MSHFKSQDEIPMSGRTITSQFFRNPKITIEKIFANMPMFGECHVGKTLVDAQVEPTYSVEALHLS
jgi:hypothetical protein